MEKAVAIFTVLNFLATWVTVVAYFKTKDVVKKLETELVKIYLVLRKRR